MDRSEISKRVERAEKLLQKGKTAEALNEYLEVLTAEPANDSICQMAADLSLSLQRVPEAVVLLGQLFDRQIQAGDGTRASLTYKKLARYVNPSWEQKLRFGELLENTNRKLAAETYEAVFQELTKAGKKPESLAVLQKILNLDPGHKNLLRLAELSSALGEGKRAAAAFLKLAETTQAAGENATQWIERAYSEDPSDPQIALAYSKGLLDQQQIGAAIFVLESLVNGGVATREIRETYANALLAANRLTDAEPVLWGLFEENPSSAQAISDLINRMLTADQDTDAVALARKLEQYQQRKGERRGFLATMQRLMAEHSSSIDFLEFMSEQFNAANRETEYCQTLLRLFDLYCETGNFEKAAEFLDRAVEVDIYEHGHKKRLEALSGKIDDKRLKVISSRLSSVSEAIATPAKTDEKLLGAAALQDLMLQAEILVQYGMRSKAIERLQRIQQVFPHEEERNNALQQLYMAAGMVPTYSGSESGSAPRAAAPPASTANTPAPSGDMSGLARVAEITRKLYRQPNADAVMSTAVNEIGAQWKASRCVLAMRKPGLSPTSVKEYCAAGDQSDSGVLTRVVVAVHDLAIAQNAALQVANVQGFADLQAQRDAFGQLRATAVLALPLMDGTEHIGVLVLLQTEQLAWSPNDVVAIKTICDQIIIALNNAGLRRLVKNLSVTDERSGLMKRASYFDLLMAETRRNLQQATQLSVLLVQFGDKAAMLKEFGEPAVETIMQEIGRLFSTNIRQNDLAFRYEMTTIAIVLGETSEKEGLMAAEKLQKLSAQVRPPEKQEAPPFAAGLAESVMRSEYDPVDIVTEVANRAEQALNAAIAHGWGKIVALPASKVSAAVA